MGWVKAAGLAACLGAFLLSIPAARAEVGTVRIAKQYGISYLPLTLMEEEKLFEEHARRDGLDLKVEWLRFSAGSGMNDGILSGSLDMAAGGVGPLLTIWGRTRNNLGVKGISALNAMPLYLVTTKASVKTIADFTDADRIALPGVKTSGQAIILSMAAERMFGPGEGGRLDRLTVAMGHPDAYAAMMGGVAGINAHFGASPFQEQELADPRGHKVLDSYDVLGGPHTFNLVWATTRFVTANPKVVKAFAAALDDSLARIKADPARVAALWVKAEGAKISPAEAERLVRDPKNEWTTTPKRIMPFLDYMNRAGLVPARTTDWREIFFPAIHGADGS